jgi:uncharacterized cupredoxin-like copper-binding protein
MIPMNLRLRRLSLIGCAVALMTATACSTGGGSTSPSQGTPSQAASEPAGSEPAGSPAAGTVDVTLQEWAVVPAVDTTTAGDVTFSVTNDGPEDTHEFVVIKTDLAPESLPTAADGSVDESGDGVEVVDEIEDVAVGSTEELSVTLEPGSYVLICNIFDAAENEAHYQKGMRIGFTVTQ